MPIIAPTDDSHETLTLALKVSSSFTLGARVKGFTSVIDGRYYRSGRSAMYLQYYINENGDKVYTVKKESPLGRATESAHPARFSPDDKYSRQRIMLKKRFQLLPTQHAPPKY